ncbi:MAG: flavodoxin domain-containing protein [Mangrovibacterium sp.]
MKNIGIFFGPENGSVHRVASKIAAILGEDKVDLIPVAGASATDVDQYQHIIFGISTVGKETWDSEYDNKDWIKFFPEIVKINYANKKIALYGLGDHVTYGHNFVDAMGKLYHEIKVTDTKANIIAPVSTSSYDYTDSEAVVNNQFVGLPIDEDFEADLTQQRLELWLQVVAKEFGI